MGKEVDAIKCLYSIFPKLKDDIDFKLTSPSNPNYNCIAWACHYNDRWMWPGGIGAKIFDGFQYWPDGVEDDEDIAAFIKAFQLKGYSICEDYVSEAGYRKIALYVKNGTTQCTHASRELSSGKWTSKLGSDRDIQHGTPFSIEGEAYGKVYCIMKKEYI